VVLIGSDHRKARNRIIISSISENTKSNSALFAIIIIIIIIIIIQFFIIRVPSQQLQGQLHSTVYVNKYNYNA
jgi:hypothetical protein